MASAPELILQTLDRHLTAPGHIRLLGGAALILGYGRERATEDADLLLEDTELRDLEDVRWVFEREALDAAAVLEAARTAMVPAVLRETWEAALPRLEATLKRR